MSPEVTPWTTPHVRRVRVHLHGHDLHARIGGTHGPVLVLVHGLLGSGASFEPALAQLARTHRVVAPDLVGHGESEKPPGDYSLGAFATQARDLLTVLGVEAATVVGHSLGGGVALQFAHQFPGLVERLVLVDSGGLGRDVTPALRAVTLPGAEYVLPAVFNRWTRAAGRQVLRPLQRWTPPGTSQVVSGLDTLADADSRAAFVHTARAVLDAGGQRVSAADRVYLAEALPLLLVWGGADTVIPVSHAHELHALLPGSRLEVFAGAGHFPQVDDPARFAAVVAEFVAATAAEVLTPTERERRWAAAVRGASTLDDVGAVADVSPSATPA